MTQARDGYVYRICRLIGQALESGCGLMAQNRSWPG